MIVAAACTDEAARARARHRIVCPIVVHGNGGSAREEDVDRARALLAAARCRVAACSPTGDVAMVEERARAVDDAKRAAESLESSLGKCHPEVCAARVLCQSLTSVGMPGRAGA